MNGITASDAIELINETEERLKLELDRRDVEGSESAMLISVDQLRSLINLKNEYLAILEEQGAV